MIGISPATVRRYEGMNILPKRPYLESWARITGYDIDWLRTGVEPAVGSPDGGPGLTLHHGGNIGREQESIDSRCISPLRLAA